MRKLILVVWLLIPVAALAYHYGPGQERLRLDDVADLLERADAHAAAEEWVEAEELYSSALEQLPKEHVAELRSVRLQRAKAQMLCSQLPEARRDLEELVDELEQDAKADATVLFEARDALANAQYYMTWLMRLEGLPRVRWEPEVEASRQNYRLLAQVADESGRSDRALQSRENLEAAIRLARMDLGELQGLPLPSQ